MSEIVENIHDNLRDRVGNRFNVSYEYPGIIMVCEGGRGVAIGDVNGFIGWNTVDGETDSECYEIDPTLSVDIIVDELVAQIDGFKYFKNRLGE